jgi:hypothetical protein
LPEFALENAQDDSAFAAAYDVVSAEQRAWLKTAIARLHIWYGENKTASIDRVATWRQGFISEERLEPLSWVLVAMEADFRSPSRLLAAILPPLLAGVELVLAVRVHYGRKDHNPWPARLLTACELAGQELALDLTAEQMGDLAKTLAGDTGAGLVLSLEEGRDPARPAVGWLPVEARKAGVAVWRPRWDGRIGIWAPARAEWNWEALHWAHPDAALDVWGPKRKGLPESVTMRKGNIDDFIVQGYPAAFAPSDAQAEALDGIPLVLGPGHECCWLWPDLEAGICRRRSVAWTSPVDSDSSE